MGLARGAVSAAGASAIVLDVLNASLDTGSLAGTQFSVTSG
jgi:hypothetical protein